MEATYRSSYARRFSFSDSIANNIAISEEVINKEKLLYAVETANIKDFIESLPLKYNSKIGMEGSGVSQGQKQRLLIARAIYKAPLFLFFLMKLLMRWMLIMRK